MGTATRIARSRLIGATPEAVWQTLAAFDRIGDWAKSLDHACATTAATAGVGAGRRIQVGRVALLETVTTWSPPQQLAYSIVGLPRVAGQVSNHWTLEAVADGTRATLTTSVDPGARLAGRIAAAVLARVLARASDQLLDGLAQLHAPGAAAAERR
jgi:hypothetical protein